MNGSTTERDFDFPWLFRRTPILTALAEQPLTNGELTNRLDNSRTTIYRATSEMAEAGLIEETKRGFQLTPLGTTLTWQAQWFRRAIKNAKRLAPALNVIDTPLFWRHLPLFETATIHEATPEDPYCITEQLQSLVRGASVWYGLYTNTGANAIITQQLDALSGDTRADLVGPPASLERSNGGDASARDEQVQLTHIEGTPLDVQIFDDRAVIAGVDPDTGYPTVLVETENTEAVDWAHRIYAHYRTKSRR